MARYLLLLLLTLTASTGFTQKSPCMPKAYAYSREVHAGAAPTVIVDQDGKTHEPSNNPVMQYFIYAEVPPSCSVSVKNVWINRTLYQIKVEAVKKTPVILVDNSLVQKPQPDILVPKSANTVLQIIARSKSSAGIAVPASLSKIKNASDVIIEYSSQGKRYYYTISPIKRLDPLSGQ